MKKYFFRLFLFILIIFNIIIITNYYKKIFSNDQIIIKSKSEEIINNELLSYLYETQIDSGIYQTTNESNWDLTNYRFNSKLSKCQNGSKLSYNEITKQVTLQGNKADKCYLYFDQVSHTKFSDYIKSLYTSDGANGIYFHDGVGTYTNAKLEAGDNSYRFSGAYPKNFVCFGISEEVCPAENLYRIIGVFNNGGEEQVKLIKWDFATNEMLGTGSYSENDFVNTSYANYKGAMTVIPRYYWSGSSSNQSNTWSSSTLNTSALNTNFMTYLGSEWTEMIDKTTWKVGGNTYDNIIYQNAKTAYTSEIVSPAESTEYEDEIGLMYVSEYMYAASPTYWSYSGYNSSDAAADYRAAVNDNWMYSGVSEWSIACRSDFSAYSFRVNGTGNVNNYNVNDSYGIRPVFNLKNDVVYVSGEGSIFSPYRISI